MPEPLHGPALREASMVLRRLVGHVENGTLAATEQTQLITAASWRGAADALSAAAAGDEF